MAAHLIAVGVVGVDPNRADREIRRKSAATTAQQRQADERAAKLADVKDQVATGNLVIRSMSRAERTKWAKRSSAKAASSTPTELAAKAAALERRRGQAARRAGGL
jgi:hypothetical protein